MRLQPRPANGHPNLVFMRKSLDNACFQAPGEYEGAVLGGDGEGAATLWYADCSDPCVEP